MIPYINQLLNNWARWRLGAGGGPLGVHSCIGHLVGERDPSDAPPEPPRVPLNDLECAATDKAVCALPPNERKIVTEFYCYAGQHRPDLLRRCGCSNATLYRVLHQAHQEIMGHLNDIAAGIEVRAYGYQEARDALLQKPIDAVRQNPYISGKLV